MKIFTQLAILGLAIPGVAQASAPVDVIIAPKPQAFANTCQSYGLAFALASAPGSPYRISTVADLRAVEQDLRSKIESVAKKEGKTAYHHEVWRLAIHEYTSGLFALEWKDYSDPKDFYKAVGKHTGVHGKGGLGPTLNAALAKGVVLASFTQIDDSSYPSGHIAVVLGRDGGDDTEGSLLILNPAVKQKNLDRNACDLNDLPGDTKYQAITAWVNRLAVKEYGAGRRLFWLNKSD